MKVWDDIKMSSNLAQSWFEAGPPFLLRYLATGQESSEGTGGTSIMFLALLVLAEGRYADKVFKLIG